MTAANFGWLIQFVHRWPASKMILHVFRVYIMHASNVNIFVKKKQKSNFNSKFDCNQTHSFQKHYIETIFDYLHELSDTFIKLSISL
jgi:hypothetical protein